jgi:hypothetical protein
MSCESGVMPAIEMRRGRTPAGPLAAVDLMTILVGVFGAAVRLREYVFNRSLWLDEAMLALNVMGGGLDIDVSDQAAPVGFRALTRLAVNMLGASEPVLRLTPLIAGIAGIVVLYKIAAAYYDKRTAFYCVFLMSLSGLLIYYSTEFKQYSVDGLVGACLLFEMHRWTAGSPRADYSRLAVLGVGAVLLSHPACLMLGALGIVLVGRAVAERRGAAAAAIAACAALWFLVFAVAFRVNVMPAASSRGMQMFHQSSFAPLSVSTSTVKWYVNAIESFFMYALDPRLWLMCLVMFAIGMTEAWRRARPMVWFIGLNAILLWVASTLHLYPIHQRFLIFLYPPALLLIALGAARLTRAPAAPAIVVLLVVAHPLFVDRFRELIRPVGREETRALVATVLTHRKPGDGLVVWTPTAPAYVYYREVTAEPGGIKRNDFVRLDGDLGQLLSRGEVTRAIAAAGSPQFWVLASHMNAGGFGADNLRTLRDTLAAESTIEREWVERDGFLWYCSLRPGDSTTGQ